MLKRFVANYVARHRNRTNQALHLIGVPMTFVASAIFAGQGAWWWAAGCFVGGYVFQFAGHAIEGNDAGELILLKRSLGMPYVEFGPESAQSKSTG